MGMLSLLASLVRPVGRSEPRAVEDRSPIECIDSRPPEKIGEPEPPVYPAPWWERGPTGLTGDFGSTSCTGPTGPIGPLEGIFIPIERPDRD
jgi:hypothetical protein